eukprot:5254774-Pleurochrysis_carterae.AAC.3
MAFSRAGARASSTSTLARTGARASSTLARARSASPHSERTEHMPAAQDALARADARARAKSCADA